MTCKLTVRSYLYRNNVIHFCLIVLNGTSRVRTSVVLVLCKKDAHEMYVGWCCPFLDSRFNSSVSAGTSGTDRFISDCANVSTIVALLASDRETLQVKALSCFQFA